MSYVTPLALGHFIDLKPQISKGSDIVITIFQILLNEDPKKGLNDLLHCILVPSQKIVPRLGMSDHHVIRINVSIAVYVIQIQEEVRIIVRKFMERNIHV